MKLIPIHDSQVLMTDLRKPSFVVSYLATCLEDCEATFWHGLDNVAMANGYAPKVQRSSGNVFADLGLDNPEELQADAEKQWLALKD